MSLWSANAGMKSLFGALNAVYHERKRRSLVWFALTTFAFTLGAIAFTIIALPAIVAVPVILDFVGLTSVCTESGSEPKILASDGASTHIIPSGRKPAMLLGDMRDRKKLQRAWCFAPVPRRRLPPEPFWWSMVDSAGRPPSAI
jgi:hypothetical protein